MDRNHLIVTASENEKKETIFCCCCYFAIQLALNFIRKERKLCEKQAMNIKTYLFKSNSVNRIYLKSGRINLIHFD